MSKAILTIDDIASKNTPAIVDYLNEKGITPILFGWGEMIEKNYAEAVYALQHGMPVIGNHSYSHPAFSTLSLNECIYEIEKNEEVLNKLYEDAGVLRTKRPFRFPYGDKGGANKEALQDYLAEHGFDKVKDTEIKYSFWQENGLDKDIDTFWTFDFAEYNIRKGSGFTKEDVQKRIDMAESAEGGAIFEKDAFQILLLHAHDETEELVPEYYKTFIDYFLSKGVQFVNTNDLFLH